MTSSNRPDLQRFLDRLTSRSVLSTDEMEAILSLPGRDEHVQSNRDFVRLGECTDSACLVVEGMVGRFGQNADGVRQITAVHIPGDMPDLLSTVQPTAGSALQALSVATIRRVPHEALRCISGQYPAIAEAFWRDCVVDAGIAGRWVVNLGSRDSRTRLAHLVCEVGARLKADRSSDVVSFRFAVTQTQLAEMTGMTPVHVNRTLKALRVDRLVDVTGKLVHIPSWKALAAVGQFEPRYLQMDIKPQDRLRIAQPA